MINLYLSGGLGNQMFQYAFARTLQIQTNQELCFCLDEYNNGWNNSYALDNFNIEKSIKIVNSKNNLLRKLAGIHWHFYSKRFSSPTYVSKICIANSGYAFLDISKNKFASNIVIEGHYQSHKWFESQKDIIKEELKVVTKPSNENVEMINAIKSNNSVCVHIRRGDYLDARWQHLNICNYDYYKKAMNHIAENVKDPVFYVFSNNHDEIEWIKENYDFSNYNVEYVDLNNPDYEELRLMYSCKHFIISNSTFSWWAQYLSENQDKIVCAPSVWNKRRGSDYRNIYMDDWKLIIV